MPRDVSRTSDKPIKIMKRTLFALAALALLLPATAQVSKAVDVSVDFFYNNLSGGSWIEVADYGYCWQPDIVVSNAGWRPYSDGYWAYTDLGWTWVSYEDFGWACYHYGRWARLTDYGWVWVPGRDEDLEWGPAWVSWRTGSEYVGWAPLPPARIAFHEGVSIGGHVDIEFNIGPSYYNFVDVRYIGEPVLRERIVAVNQNVTYINQTVNVTNITYKNKTVYNYGPDINVINTRAARPIQRLKLERQENVDINAAAKSGALMKPQGDKLVVAAPMRIRKAERQVAPPTVKTKVAKANLDTGWSSVSDPNVQTQLKQKMKTESTTGATGAGAAGQVSAGASPAAGATASPAPVERGRGKHKNRPGEPVEQSAAAAGAAPAGAASPAEGTSPAGAASPAEATTMPERGKHKGKRGEQFQTTTPPTGGASPGAETATSPAGAQEAAQPGGGRHKGRERLEQQGNVGQTPGQLEERGQGKQKGRRLEQSPQPVTSPATGGGASEPQAQGGGGKRKAERAYGQPSSPEGQQAQGQGKREGGKKHKAEEASPAPSPQ
jgi:hypothetical protein